MVFVNNLGGAPGVPEWTQHLPARTDGYTVADMVLPWFLFLVGASLPPSLGRHLAPGPQGSPWRAARRILPRVAGLLLLGLIFVNHGRLDPAATGLSADLWLVLAVAAAVLFLRRTAQPPSRRDRMGKVVAGLALAVLLVLYRGEAGDGASTWLRPGWWGILGIIGWAYGVGAIIYLLSRGHPVGLMGALGLLTAVAIGTEEGRYGWLTFLSWLFGVHEFLGSFTAIVVAGALAGRLVFVPDSRPLRNLVLLGAGLWLAGWFLRPLHGYHKLGATESWALVAAGQGALMLALAHLLADRPGRRRPPGDEPPMARSRDPEPGFERPGRTGPLVWLGEAGRSALLAYLLSEWLHPASRLVGLDLTPLYDRGGAWAMANAALVAVAVLAMAALAARRRFEVKL